MDGTAIDDLTMNNDKTITETQRHHLLAILAADVAGYSRLMSLDDKATVAALDAARAVFREQILAHRGRVIDVSGDSVLAVFDTAVGADDTPLQTLPAANSRPRCLLTQ